MSISLNDFLRLRKELPTLDVRSEAEHASGHIPASINLPILNNHERAIVGTTYKQQGQQQAILEGFKLVGPRLAQLVQDAQQAVPNREALVYCWRGGMRSNNFSQFVGMAGIKAHTLLGGYKTYRQTVQYSFELPLQLILLTGYTGSGKSQVLRKLKEHGEQVIDLEQLAKHKGSAFGGLLMPAQPTTEQFENNLFEELTQLDLARPVWMEDESIAIGKIFLPQPLWKSMSQGSIISLDVPKEVRVERLVQEYGIARAEDFLACMSQVIKKLGGQHYQAARELYLAGNLASAIDLLLVYYDKAYQNSIERRSERMIASLPWMGKDEDAIAKALIETVRSNPLSKNRC